MRQWHWVELFNDYECDIHYHPGKANVVADALSRKEREKPLDVRALRLTIQMSLTSQICKAQREVLREENLRGERLRGLECELIPNADGVMYFINQIWVPLRGNLRELVMNEARKSSYHASIKVAPFEALYGRKYRSPLRWAEVGERQLTGPELIQETTDKVALIMGRLKVVANQQKSYADNRRKSLQFQVGDRVLLKVSPWKGVIRFGKGRKLSPRYIGPFEILSRVGPIAYRLELPQELDGVHDVFQVSNLKKCLSDETLIIPPNEVQIDNKLRFIEERVEVLDEKIQKLRRS
ncbi:uncharacterized protein LOC110900545 [Helianthus annuus]|uniref:uncharacterized protein LOC110900545 n=1 Tax=Helianthus annuus TaxID=4232 RepID=UPI000B900AD8|nr:uncharacterized protein LOC110900545 [Helianthus annuus]